MKFEEFLNPANVEDCNSYIVSLMVQLSQLQVALKIQNKAENGGYLPEAQQQFCHIIALNISALIKVIRKQILDVYDRIDCNDFQKFLQLHGLYNLMKTNEGENGEINEPKNIV